MVVASWVRGDLAEAARECSAAAAEAIGAPARSTGELVLPLRVKYSRKAAHWTVVDATGFAAFHSMSRAVCAEWLSQYLLSQLAQRGA
jgi:hypothetical protein